MGYSNNTTPSIKVITVVLSFASINSMLDKSSGLHIIYHKLSKLSTILIYYLHSLS